MSFSPGHVVMLLLVIALVVPALIQVCGAPRPPSCARSTPPQWAARPADRRRPLCQAALRRTIPFCCSAGTSSATVHGTLAAH